MRQHERSSGLQSCPSDFDMEPDGPSYEAAFELVQKSFQQLLHYASEAISIGNFKVKKARANSDRSGEFKRELQLANRKGVIVYCQEFVLRCLLDYENSSLCQLTACSLSEFAQSVGAEQYALLLLDALSTVECEEDIQDEIAIVIVESLMTKVGSDRASLMECCFDYGQILLRDTAVT
jgi:hypothetical protein